MREMNRRRCHLSKTGMEHYLGISAASKLVFFNALTRPEIIGSTDHLLGRIDSPYAIPISSFPRDHKFDIRVVRVVKHTADHVKEVTRDSFLANFRRR